MTAFRIIRHVDSRDRWYEVESMTADGRRAWIATLDTADEARDLVRRLEADAARPAVDNQAARDAATQAELDAARARAAKLRTHKRGTFARLQAADVLRAARAAYLAADEAAELAR